MPRLLRPRAPLCAAVLLLVVACQRAVPESATSADEPKVQGDGVTLSEAAERAGGLETVAAVAAAAPTVVLPGRLAWDEERTVRVSSPFSGRVVAIEARPGDHVKAGQTLAWLSSADYGSAQADVRKAQAALVVARKAAARSEDLYQHGVIAARDAEQAAADAAAAEAEAQRADARLRLFGDRASGVDQRYRLSSPIDGTVVERSINPGQEVLSDGAGAPLFVVSDPAHLWVQLDEPESALAAVRPGQTVVLTTAVYPGERFEATLDQIADFVDPQTRTLRLRGHLDNRDRRLKAEMYVSATLQLPATAPPPPSVPAAAVFLIGDRQQLFVAEAGHRYVRRSVRTGELHADRVSVLEGLAPGERVVVAGNLYLQQLLANAPKDGS